MTAMGSGIGPAVLVTDDLITGKLTAEQAARLRALAEEVIPPEWGDQIDAATAHIQSRMPAAAREHGLHRTVRPAPEVAEWVRLGALTALAEWVAGSARTCMHAPNAFRPQPVAAAAWKPGLIVCGNCTHLYGLREGSIEDRTCDCCGRVTTGPELGDGITPHMLHIGPLVWTYGTCRDCLDDGGNS